MRFGLLQGYALVAQLLAERKGIEGEDHRSRLRVKPCEEPEASDLLGQFVLVSVEAERGAELFEAPVMPGKSEATHAGMTTFHVSLPLAY